MWRNRTRRNIAVVQRFFDELWNATGDVTAADRLVAHSHMHHSPDGDLVGPEGVKQLVTGLRATFPDMRTTIEDIIAAGDKVVVRFAITGTYQGAAHGTSTGKQVRSTGIDIFQLTQGRIVERWGETDALGLMRQLGALPSTDA